MPPLRLPVAPEPPPSAVLPLGERAEPSIAEPPGSDPLTPRFLALLEEDNAGARGEVAAASERPAMRTEHVEELRAMWQQALYRQGLLGKENERLRLLLAAQDGDGQDEPPGTGAPATPPCAQWDAHAAAVQDVLGGLPLYRTGLPAETSPAACGLRFTDVTGSLAWIDRQLCSCGARSPRASPPSPQPAAVLRSPSSTTGSATLAVAANFPLLARLMSTPLLCRDSADERARDLLQKRDSLLLLREGPQGASASAQAVAAALGAELEREERQCHGALEQAPPLRAHPPPRAHPPLASSALHTHVAHRTPCRTRPPRQPNTAASSHAPPLLPHADSCDG